MHIYVCVCARARVRARVLCFCFSHNNHLYFLNNPKDSKKNQENQNTKLGYHETVAKTV